MQEEDVPEETIYRNILQLKGLSPIIFESYDLDIPHPFNTQTVKLDGRLLSDLNWKSAEDLAEKAASKGFALFWDIDLGLFDHLSMPISNQTQFLSLNLALDHFKETIWSKFAENSVGVSIYRGNALFDLDFYKNHDQLINLRHWIREHFINSPELCEILYGRDLDKIRPGDLYGTAFGKNLMDLFCRDVCVEYLSLLASKLPDAIPCYLFLDAEPLVSDLIKQLQVLNPDRFDFLHLALKGNTLPFGHLGWRSHATEKGFCGFMSEQLPQSKEIEIGVCLPLMIDYHSSHWKGLDKVVSHLQSHGLAFKLIPESRLITQWDGLNFLFYNPDGLSAQGKRKLQGFCAAGGQVISIGEALGLPDEITFAEWLINNS